jgi:hypothetical protein
MTGSDSNRAGCFMALFILTVFFQSAEADQIKNLGEENKRSCTGEVSLLVDAEEKWRRTLTELRDLDAVVEISSNRQKRKPAIPLSSLLRETDEAVIAVEFSTCTGKLRRFEADELASKQGSLYLIITGYRGLKLHNSAGGEKKKKGNRLKGIDRIQLFTKASITPPE